MKSPSALCWTSLAADLLLAAWGFYVLAGYHTFIHQPSQGGWNLHRLCEIAPLLTPLAMLVTSLLIARSPRASRGWQYAAGAGLCISTPFVLLFSGMFIVLVIAALGLPFRYVRHINTTSRSADSPWPQPA